jgi:hypothetical protein
MVMISPWNSDIASVTVTYSCLGVPAVDNTAQLWYGVEDHYLKPPPF